MAQTSPIHGHHHLTLCVGTAQDDYAFHTKTLGLRCVKKTVLYDGRVPIYHLYYGNGLGKESTLITSFAFRSDGRVARPGSGQVKTISCSVAADALPFWEKRLRAHGHETKKTERFGLPRIELKHPAGIGYELVGVPEDKREPWTESDVPHDCAIYGVYGVTVAARDAGEMHGFMDEAMGFRKVGSRGRDTQFAIGEGKPGQIVEILETPDLHQGSWTYGEGSVHHVAFHVDDEKTQTEYKAYLEGLGFTDVSDRKDRTYFLSVYFRTPSGALFEAAYTAEKGFLVDEPLEKLGTVIQMPPWMVDRWDEYMEKIGPLED